MTLCFSNIKTIGTLESLIPGSRKKINRSGLSWLHVQLCIIKSKVFEVVFIFLTIFIDKFSFFTVLVKPSKITFSKVLLGSCKVSIFDLVLRICDDVIFSDSNSCGCSVSSLIKIVSFNSRNMSSIPGEMLRLEILCVTPNPSRSLFRPIAICLL